MTVEQIHQLGLEEVERIELEMKEIVTELGYTNISLQQFTDIIRNDPNNYYQSPEELLEAFRNIVENIIEPHLLDIFQAKPKAKLIIQSKEGLKIPKHLKKYLIFLKLSFLYFYTLEKLQCGGY